MSGRPSNNRAGGPASNPPPRMNEYFVPRDGIDREVIQSDICRYLGNDALVRPGTYETPDGQVIQGYYITAYRNLTTAMIEDLKRDSARWQEERRAAAASRGGPAPDGGSRDSPRDTNYNTWRAQRDQGYSADPYGSSMDVDAYPPVSGPGPNSGYPAQPYQPPPPVGYHPQYPPPGQPHYQPPPNYPYPPAPPQPQYSPPPHGDRYQTMPPPPPPQIPAGYGQEPYVRGSDYQAGGYGAPGPNRIPPPPMPLASGAPPRTYTASAGPGPAYGADPDQYNGYMQGQAAGAPPPQPFPTDGLYGRGSPAGAPQRAPFPSPGDPAYDEDPKTGIAKPNSPPAASPSQVPPPSARRERDRDSEPPRDPGYRDYKARRTDDRDGWDRDRHRR
ncbi:hypothetical protein VTJ04DRAFT_2335 [Mycothermus thermophilus]|uniref:uncharacterized protein n=1 Tax=Humicola insolens TaxID=85995 RepID=UPI003742B7B8